MAFYSKVHSAFGSTPLLQQSLIKNCSYHTSLTLQFSPASKREIIGPVQVVSDWLAVELPMRSAQGKKVSGPFIALCPSYPDKKINDGFDWKKTTTHGILIKSLYSFVCFAIVCLILTSFALE